MRIISSFKDFYDNIPGSYEKDPRDVIFKRESSWDKNVFHQDKAFVLFPNYNNKYGTTNYTYTSSLIECGYIGFCGRAYPIFYFYTLDKFMTIGSFLKEMKKKSNIFSEKNDTFLWDYLKNNFYISTSSQKKDIIFFSNEGLNRFINETPGYIEFNPEFHVKIGSPIFMKIPEKVNSCYFLRGGNPYSDKVKKLERHYKNSYGYVATCSTFVNPNIKFFELTNFINPFEAHQELDMFVNNFFGQKPDPIPERTQELIRDAHGFDKYSFKNQKSVKP